MMLQLGVMLKMFFSPIRVTRCEHLFCNELWLIIFLCSCVVYCAYDMDHVSAINHQYNAVVSH